CSPIEVGRVTSALGGCHDADRVETAKDRCECDRAGKDEKGLAEIDATKSTRPSSQRQAPPSRAGAVRSAANSWLVQGHKSTVIGPIEVVNFGPLAPQNVGSGTYGRDPFVS